MILYLDSGAKKIIDILHACGYEGYIVGGCVRDLLGGRIPQDWDITTNARPEEVKKLFVKTADTGVKYGTVTVLLGEKGYEVTTYRVDGVYTDARRPEEVSFNASLWEDLSRRDFTVNAMAYNHEDGLIDCFGGAEDLENKLLKTVGNPEARFAEDALRMLRAVRFSCTYDLRIEENTFSAIRKNSAAISRISQERCRDELNKILLSKRPAEGVDLLRESGLLPYFLPEVALMVGFEQNSPHHHKDVFGHTLLVLDNVSNQLILRLAALLHDIGKPPTYSEDEKGRGHFYNHHVIGAQITQLVLSRLKYDADTVRRVSILVREHMSRFYFLRDKSTKRFINRVGVDNLDSLFELQEADIKGSKPPCDFGRLTALKNEVTKILIEKQPLTLKDLAVNGHDLRQAGVEPGERMGLILNALLEKVLETPELNTKEELLKLIKYI